MKKLLSLLGAITLVGSSVTTVVACGNKETNKKTAQDVANKITNKNIALPAKTNPDTANPATILALKSALQSANPNLKADDLQDITFSKVILKIDEVPNNVKANIKVGTTEDSVDLNVIISYTESGVIANKITNKNISLPAKTSTNTANSATIDALRKALQKANSTLSNADLQKITFAKVTLLDNEQKNSPLLATITANNTETSVDLNVEIHSTAAEIKAKLQNTDLLVMVILSTETTLTQNNVNKAMAVFKKINYGLSDWDKKQLSLQPSSTSLPVNNTVGGIPMNISDDSQSSGTSTNVSIIRFDTDSDRYKADVISYKISINLPVYIRAGSNTSITNDGTITQIKTNLKIVNPTLTDSDLAKMTLNTYPPGTPLKNNEANNHIFIDIKVNTATVQRFVVIKIHKTALQIKTSLQQVARFNISFINSEDNKLSQNNINKVLTIFKANNPEIGTWDKAQLSIDVDTSKSLTADTREDVTLKIKDDALPTAGNATITLKVARCTSATSDSYKAFQIADKIGGALVTPLIAGSNASVSANTVALRSSLITVNSDTKLTVAEADKITFSGNNLTDDENNNTVTARVTVGTATTDINLTKVQINRTANQIKNQIQKIPGDNVTILGSGFKSTDPDIVQKIQYEIQKLVPALSQRDATKIAVTTDITVTKSYQVVTLSITDDASPSSTVTQNINLKGS